MFPIRSRAAAALTVLFLASTSFTPLYADPAPRAAVPCAQASPALSQADAATPQASPATSQASPATPQASPAAPQASPAATQTSPAAPQASPVIPQASPAIPQASPATPPESPAAPSPSPAPSPVSTPGPTGGQFHTGSEEGFGLGTIVADPTALYGPTRVPVVLPGNSSISTVSIPFYFAAKPARDQRFLLEGEADYTQFGVDASYAIKPRSMPGIFTVNVYDMRGRLQAYEGGRFEVNLLDPSSLQPWFYQAGGGAEYTVSTSAHLRLSAALNYRQVSVHSGPFTGRVAPFDQQGQPLTVDPDGLDEWLTARVVGLYQTLDDLQFPTRGTKLRFGFEQSIPIGNAAIKSTQAQMNFTQFIPTHFFGIGKGQRTLILNVQAGTILGDTPGYVAYNLGGVNATRGWAAGVLGTGQSFFEATAEYRFPLAKVNAFGQKLDIRGMFFADYSTDLNSAGLVLGKPALVRGKPGEGSGAGGGIHVQSPFGLVRLEFGVNNLGGFEGYFTIGDRY